MKHCLAALLLCATLSACQTAPPVPGMPAIPAAPATSARPDGIRAFEKQQRERATALEQQGALFDAAMALEVLTLIDPAEYQPRLASLQKRIDAQAQEHLARARQELKRGDLATAETFYLGVVSLQPQNKEAADALRTIERSRSRQERLLKPGRTLSTPDGTGRRPSTAATAAGSNPLLMEQASNQANQGEIDEAIELVAGQLKAVPGDLAARDLLADLLHKKALSLQGRDASGAMAALKRCLQLSPKHVGCNALQAATAARPRAKP